MNKLAVLGLGIENLALVKYFIKHGEMITVCDSRNETSLGERYQELKRYGVNFRLGSNYLDNLTDFDIVFRSPGLPLFDSRLHQAQMAGVKITSAMRLFLDLCPCRTIGVTGTKGKGTTSSLIAQILKYSQAKKGLDVYLGGNIGIAPFEFLETIQPEDVVVLELSSFQLEDFEKSVHVAVITNITEDHLASADPLNPNHHKSRKDYIIAKTNLFRHQKSSDLTILNMEDATCRELIPLVSGDLLTYGAEAQQKGAWFEKEPAGYYILWNINQHVERLIHSSKIQVRGEHNLLNICAAALASQAVDADPDSIRRGISEFTGLEHRLEYVGVVNGVQFYDDSFATAPDPTIVAIKAFIEPIILIAGGADKGADFTGLAEVILHSAVKTIILIGTLAPRIRKEVEETAQLFGLPIPAMKEGGKDMREIVTLAYHGAVPGDVILLSTACASFDMFKNYKERGKLFKAAVQNLINDDSVKHN